MAAIPNPFRRADRRQQFEAMLGDYAARAGALFHADGRENHSNNIGGAFWRGFHAQMAAWVDVDTPLYVAYMAGRQIAAAASQAAAGARPDEAQDAPAGYWREPGLRPAAGAQVTWTAPGPTGLKVWIGQVNGRQVASIRRHPANRGASCVASLKGWMWTNHLEGTAAQRMRVKETPSRGFTSLAAAKRAIDEVIRHG